MQETKRKHLTVEQIMAIGKAYLVKATTMEDIAASTKLDKSQVRSAIYSLAKNGVEFPDKPRETSSKYATIAAQLVGKK